MFEMNHSTLMTRYYCFCIFCILPKVQLIQFGVHGNQIQIHVRRSSDLPVWMLRAYQTHFNTVARQEGVYAEARENFLDNNGDIEEMCRHPVRSTIWIEVTAFIAFQIVANFDPRVDILFPGVRRQDARHFLTAVLSMLGNEMFFCPEYTETRF
jgi:hypothetical protein